MSGRAATILSLSRWLGPLTPATASPRSVTRSRVRVQGPRETFDAWVYEPRGGARGALLVLPGLHYLGPADPRLDRFNRILAASGVRVLSPFLPTFARLHVGPALGEDALAAYDALVALPSRHALRRPGVFSISTGSLPAARVCARRDPAGWVSFGGYHNFAACVRFSLTGGAGGVVADPLNRPVVYLNLLRFLPDTPADTAPLERALRRYVEQTWGRAELKLEGRWRAVASRVELELEGPSRAIFRRATGVDDPQGVLGLRALAASGDAFACMDPGASISCHQGVSVVVHGRDDDVVPISEAQALHGALAAAGGDSQLFLTGMYGHTGTSRFALGDAARELRSMLGIVNGIARCAHGGEQA